jgi:glycosyltransferase involved in cell wall biosynthesis
VARQNIVSFCAALKQLGVDIELVSVGIKVMPGELQGSGPLSLYRIREPFRIRTVRMPLSQESSQLWKGINRFAVHALTATRVAASTPRTKQVTFYTRTYSAVLLVGALRALVRRPWTVAFEAHTLPRSGLTRLALARADRVIANSFALARDLIAAGHVDEGRVLGIHQGVDLALFDELRLSKEEARVQLGLPRDKKLVVYTGKISWGYREVELILDAARVLQGDSDVLFVLVGGRYDHVERYRRRIQLERRANVIFAGFVAPNIVQHYQFAADVLVLYYPSGMELNRYRSPGKLFEYMASGRPIVAVDLPVLREVLGDPPAAALVPLDSPPLLASEIEKVLGDERLASDLSNRARSRAADFTWTLRAEAIMRFISADDSPDLRSPDST